MTDTNTAEREAVARAIWALMREHEDRCDEELEDLSRYHPVWEYADAARASLAASAGSEPMFWVRLCSDGLYEGPIHNARIEKVRELSGAWSPLYLLPSPPEGMVAGWQDIATAPEKGVFLVYMPTADRDGDRIQVAVWHPNVKVVGHLFAFDCAPITHWMPLPAPPLPASEAKEL